jgi:hypothetical protein
MVGSFATVALFDTRSHRLLNGISPSPAATEPITSGNVDTSVAVDARAGAAFAATAFIRPSSVGSPAVTMLSAQTGRAVRTTLLRIPGYADGFAGCGVSGAAIDSRRASLYVPLECTAYGGGNARSFVAVLDSRRDVLRRLVPLGRGLLPGIAVDAASGRVYAYTFGSKTLTLVCAVGAVTRC